MQQARSRTPIPRRALQVLLGLLCAGCAVALGVALVAYVYGSPRSLWILLSPGVWIPGSLALFFAISGHRLLAGRSAAESHGLLSAAGYCLFAAR